MRILFLTHRIPFPPNKGDKIRAWNIVKYLAEQHDVYLASLVDEKKDLQYVTELENHLKMFIFDIVNPRIKKISGLVSIIWRKPISVSYFYSRQLQRRINSLSRRLDFDVVFCYSSPMAEYIFRSSFGNRGLNNALRVIDFIDVDSQKWAQYAEKTTGWRSLVYNYEARYLAIYEGKIARSFQRMLIISEEEKAVFQSINPTENLSVMSNGVDLDFFNPSHAGLQQIKQATIIFTGVMDYWPNIVGVTWFAKKVFPHVLSVFPAAKG